MTATNNDQTTTDSELAAGPIARHLERATADALAGAALTDPVRPGVYRMTVCERCGAFGPPDATICLVCSGQCGCPNCRYAQ